MVTNMVIAEEFFYYIDMDALADMQEGLIVNNLRFSLDEHIFIT